MKGMSKFNVLTVRVVCVLFLAVVNNWKYIILEVYIIYIMLYVLIYDV